MTDRRPALTPRQAARELGRSYVWFMRNRRKLEAQGFPKPMPVAGTYDLAAIELWKDAQLRRAELEVHSSSGRSLEDLLARRAEAIGRTLAGGTMH